MLLEVREIKKMVIKMNNYKNLFKSFFFFLILIFSFNVYSNNMAFDENGGIIYSPQSSEDLMEGLSYRFILGVFGKDALLYSLPSDLPENIYTEIQNWSPEEEKIYSKPFNNNIVVVTILALLAIFFVVIHVLILYVAWIYLEGLIHTQSSGEFLGSSWNSLFTPLKILFSILIIFPFFGKSYAPFDGEESDFGSFSLAQVVVLKAIGYSTETANDIWSSYVSHQKHYYPSIIMPTLLSKEIDMKNIIDFQICLITTNDDENSLDNLDITLLKSKSGFNNNQIPEDSFVAKISKARCNLNLSIGYDTESVEFLEKSNRLSNFASFSFNYDEIQKKVIEKEIEKVLNQGRDVAKRIVDNLALINKQRNLSGNFSKENWRNYCDSVSTIPFDSNLFVVTALSVYKTYAAKCMSENFIFNLSKAPNIAKDYPYGESNYLKGNQIELCVHTEGGKSGSSARTYVSNLFNSKINITGNDSLSEDLPSCINKLCSGVESGESSPYQCSNLISFAKTLYEQEEIIKKGWMPAGAYAYSLFSGNDFVSSKNMINKFSAKFYDSFNEEAYIDEYSKISNSNIDKITTSFSLPNLENVNYENFDIFVKNDEEFYLSKLYVDDEGEGLLGNIHNFFGDDGILGYNRFNTCIKNPLKINNGFSCGNLTEEIHFFGTKILAFAIEMKAISTVAEFLMTNKQKTSKQNGTMSSGIKDQVTRTLTTVGIGGAVFFFMDSITNTDFNSDAFSEIDSIWKQYPELASFVATMVVDKYASAGTIINIAMSILFLLGALLAFFLPLLPFFLWIIVISGFLVMVFEAMAIIPLWAVTLMTPTRDHSSEIAKKGMIIIISIIMRAPLLITGLILAWVLNDIFTGEVLNLLGFEESLGLSTSANATGLINALIVIIVYVTILYIIYNLVFSIIEGFYSIATEWLFGDSSISPFAKKERTESWREVVKSARSVK